jgi:tubulin-folding cofactor B
VSQVEKFELPKEEYEKLDDSVLAWKRRRGLGRFDPSAKSKQELEQERREKDQQVVAERGVEVGKRCRVGGDDGRRGVVRWVGEVEGLGGEKERGCTWVGVEFDEPGGRNDGSVIVTVTDYAERGTGEKDKDGKEEDDDENGKAIAKPTSKANHQGKTKNIRLFQCTPNYGVLARPEKIEMGDWPVLDDLGVDSDMEEI